jgi:hypothetical protein
MAELESGIGDFALSLLEEAEEKIEAGEAQLTVLEDGSFDFVEAGESNSSPGVSDAPSLAGVEVADDFVGIICEQGHWNQGEIGAAPARKKVPAPKQSKQKIVEQASTPKPRIDEARSAVLIDRIQRAATELVECLKEMTTCG